MACEEMCGQQKGVRNGMRCRSVPFLAKSGPEPVGSSNQYSVFLAKITGMESVFSEAFRSRTSALM